MNTARFKQLPFLFWKPCAIIFVMLLIFTAGTNNCYGQSSTHNVSLKICSSCYVEWTISPEPNILNLGIFPYVTSATVDGELEFVVPSGFISWLGLGTYSLAIAEVRNEDNVVVETSLVALRAGGGIIDVVIIDL